MNIFPSKREYKKLLIFLEEAQRRTDLLKLTHPDTGTEHIKSNIRRTIVLIREHLNPAPFYTPLINLLQIPCSFTEEINIWFDYTNTRSQ